MFTTRRLSSLTMDQHLVCPSEDRTRCKDSEVGKIGEELDTMAPDLQLLDIQIQIHKLEDMITRLQGTFGCSYKEEGPRTLSNTVNHVEDRTSDQRVRDTMDQTTQKEVSSTQRGKRGDSRITCYTCGNPGHKRGNPACPKFSKNSDLFKVTQVIENSTTFVQLRARCVPTVTRKGIFKLNVDPRKVAGQLKLRKDLVLISQKIRRGGSLGTWARSL